MSTRTSPQTPAKDLCPHCGAFLDVHRALQEDGAAVSGARRRGGDRTDGQA